MHLISIVLAALSTVSIVSCGPLVSRAEQTSTAASDITITNVKRQSSIGAPGGAPSQPAGTTLIQIGFGYSLNWDFVVSHQEAQNQIFAYTPPMVGYDLNIAQSQVVVKNLEPLDTQSSLGYTTTLVKFYLRTGLINQFANDVKTPSSRLYNNPNKTIDSLAEQINPNIPVR